MSLDCPPEEELAGLFEGRLGPEDSARVHRHVRGCESCRLVLAGLGEAAEPVVSGPTTPSGSIDEAPLQPGQRVGRFALVRLIGLGGMGAVWAARDPELGRDVAIKVLRIGQGSDNDRAQARRRMLIEAKAMARLAHPNVVPVFEVGEMGERLFIVLELVEGETLGKWLQAPRTLDQILDAFLAAGRGLSAAHQSGIVHRDFKPDNVLVGRDGRPRVTDFGLARRSGPGDAESLPPGGPTLAQILETASGELKPVNELTPMGALLGTPAYMSPEQMQGGRADARSDLFSFCTALYEAAAGTRPYPEQGFLALRRRAEAEEIEPPRKALPGWLRKELLRGLRADPSKRHASMAELLARLERGRSRRGTAGLALALVAALALFALWAARPRAGGPRRTVAVLGPQDLAPSPASDWLSGALAELLATELQADAQLRVVPAATLQPALADLGLSRGARLDGPAVQKLRRRLGAELVLGGSYRLSGGALHVALDLWGDGAHAFASAAEDGPQESLAGIAGKLGAALRAKLGDRSSASPAAQGSFPADPEAARLYVLGVSQLRTFQPGAALESLQKAEKLAPDNPRIEAALTEVYLELLYDAPAREAAVRAMQRKEELPPEDRERLEILRDRAMRERDKAVARAKAFWAQRPDDLERGLLLARLQTNLLRDYKGVLATTAELHKLPPPAGNDPRIDVFESQAATQTGDFQRGLAAARKAFAAAQAIGARQQMAQAVYNEGNALRRLGNDPAGARQKLREAEGLYVEAHDLGGAAGASVMQAAVLADGGDLQGARARFEAALAYFRQLGDRSGEGIALHNLSIVLRRLRELPAAIERSQAAQTVFLELGERGPAANSLTTLGHLREDVGDLPGAAAALAEAARIRREIKDPMLVVSLLGIASVRLQQGDLPAARRGLDDARAAGTGQEKAHAMELKRGEADLALAEDRLPDAEAAAREGARLAGEAQHVDEAALCEAILARALLRQGRVADARQAVARGKAFLAKSKTGIASGSLAVADGRVTAAENPRNPGPGIEILRTAVEQAAASGVATDHWEARLALAELEPVESRASARARLLSLARGARAQGFGLVSRQAEAAARRR